jgi:hypothetical protein
VGEKLEQGWSEKKEEEERAGETSHCSAGIHPQVGFVREVGKNLIAITSPDTKIELQMDSV